MTTGSTIAVVFVLAAIPSVLYLSLARRRSPVTLTLLAGIPLVGALCVATYVCSGGGEHAGMTFRAVWWIARIPLVLAAIAAVLYLSASRGKRPVAQDRRQPPLAVGRVAGEIGAGAALGFAALLIVYVVAIALVDEGCYAVFGFLAIFLLAFPALNGLGSAVGVYLVGSRGEQTGSLPLTLAGGFLGGLVAGVCSYLWIMGVELVLLAPLLLIAPVTATVAFNWTRRYKEPPSP